MKNIKTPMEQLTAGYEAFIKGKQTNQAGKDSFNKAIKKAAAAKSKQRGAK